MTSFPRVSLCEGFSSRRAFFLPIALGLAVFFVAVAVVMAGYLRHPLAGPIRARFAARAAASLAIDTALDQLASVAADDRAATTPAPLSHPAAAYAVAYPPGSSTPVYLTSGENPNPAFAGDIVFPTGATATSVASPYGRLAYYTQDLSGFVALDKSDRLALLPATFPDSPQALRHQTQATPTTANLPASATTVQSWGVLSNPISGGLKTDLDTAAGETLDGLPAHLRSWRDSDDFIKGRPLVWAECAVIMGIYRGDDGFPQLGAAFWADAWNPYTKALPFNPRGTTDFALRLSGPTGLAEFFNASGELLFSQDLDLSAHTTINPLGVDLYGTMTPGEIRFITHYRQLPISSTASSDVAEVRISFPAGLWSFHFQTFDGTPLQTLADLPYDGFTTRVVYKSIAVDSLKPSTAHWMFHFRRLEPIENSFATTDPRWETFPYSDKFFTYEPNPFKALSKTIFATSQTLRDSATKILFDLPSASLVSIGALNHFPLTATPAFSLGSSTATASNSLFDSAFFSGLSLAPADFSPTGASTILPNPHLRVWGSPTLAELQTSAASRAFSLGSFNLNTPSIPAWVAQLPATTYHWPFTIDSAYPDTTVDSTTRTTTATAIVNRLLARGTPWRSVSEFAAEGLLPADQLGLIAPILAPRGDTFLIHAYGQSPAADASAFATALVQRLPTPTSDTATTRRFQILSITFQ